MTTLGDGSRRSFLAAVGWTALGLLVHPALRRTGRPRTPEAWLAGRLAAAVGCPASRRAIGRAYLRTHPEEADLVVMLDAIRSGPLLAPHDPERLDRVDWKARIGRQIREDFRADRIVAVEGWLLSATEARICALSCLV